LEVATINGKGVEVEQVEKVEETESKHIKLYCRVMIVHCFPANNFGTWMSVSKENTYIHGNMLNFGSHCQESCISGRELRHI
jgi:hypothetical protein